LVAKKVVAVACVNTPDEAVRAVMVVVAKVTVEVAVSVPATRLEVVAFVAVRLVKNPVIAVKSPVKKLVLVAFVVEALVAKKLVAVAEVVMKLVIVADAEVRSEIVALVIVVVAKVEVPVVERVPVRTVFPETERAEVEALPRVV
jgi:hypothetical protein